MRFIEIDGIRKNVEYCAQCPYFEGGDGGYGCHCQHPATESASCDEWTAYEMVMPFCPLREVDG